MEKPAFIFDMGNVLFDFDEYQLVETMAEESGLPFEQVWENRIDPDVVAVETGKMSPVEYFERRIRPLVPHWEYGDLVMLWYKVFRVNSFGRSLFTNLKKAGYPVCILSNLAEFNKEAIDKKFPGFFEESTANFFSYELGFHKPDPRIYRAVTARLGLPPRDCVFFDDREENVEGARAEGWRAFHFVPENYGEITKAVREATGGAVSPVPSEVPRT